MDVPVTLDEKHIFIGVENKIKVFAVDGLSAGELVCEDNEAAEINNLTWLQQADLLIALVTKDQLQEARLYSSAIPEGQNFAPYIRIPWDNYSRIHKGITMSADGNRMAIYTNECQLGKSEIRFVNRVGECWDKWGTPLEIQALPKIAEKRRSDEGITGAALYNPFQVILI